MGLRSGGFLGQSNNFVSGKSSSFLQMKDTGHDPIGIFLHQEMPFSYLECLFFNYINVFVSMRHTVT